MLNSIYLKTEDKILQDVEVTKKKKAEAEQAKLLKEQQKKEKKAAKEAAKEATATSERRRGSISDKWRSRKTGVDASMKSPPTSPILPKLTSPLTPTSTPPASPLVITEQADSILPPSLDISDKQPRPPPSLSTADQQEEDAGFLPSLRDESLIFSTEDMHEVIFPPFFFCNYTCLIMLAQLRRYLPGYYKWMDWKLLYSTQTHGIRYAYCLLLLLGALLNP